MINNSSSGQPAAARVSALNGLFEVPAHLRPNWTELPALARIVTDRHANNMIHWPMAGPAIRLAATTLNLATLTGAHLSARLIACNTQAVMWFKPLYTRETPLLARMRDRLPSKVALIPVTTVYLALAASIITVSSSPALSGILFWLAFSASIFNGAGVAAMTRRGNTTRAIRPMLAAVGQDGTPLVLACGLASARQKSSRGAVTAMLLPLRRQANHLNVTVLANAATDELVPLYQRMGFQQLPTGERHLIRTPTRPRQAHQGQKSGLA